MVYFYSTFPYVTWIDAIYILEAEALRNQQDHRHNVARQGMSSIVLSRKSTFEGEQNISSDKVCTKLEI